MTAKEYLEQIEMYDIKIKQLEHELECLRETAGGSSAIRYDKERVQVSIMADAVERSVLQLMELEDRIFVERTRLATLKRTIIEQIQSLDDRRYVDLLYKRYVEQKKFFKISEETHYDYDYVRVLHGEALGYFVTKHPEILSSTRNHTNS